LRNSRSILRVKGELKCGNKQLVFKRSTYKTQEKRFFKDIVRTAVNAKNRVREC
jgi:hypothetical protein